MSEEFFRAFLKSHKELLWNLHRWFSGELTVDEKHKIWRWFKEEHDQIFVDKERFIEEEKKP